MKLKLEKPIVFFDLETTGINIGTDKIVEIAILKVFPNGNKESKTWLVNPEMEIPQASIHVHGITNEKVATENSRSHFWLPNGGWKVIRCRFIGGHICQRFGGDARKCQRHQCIVWN